jgi:hypothetical protein
MLVIRKAQLDSLALSAVDDFKLSMTERIREEFPDKYAEWGDSGVCDFLRRCLDDAARFGLEVQGTVAQFITLRCQYGERFELCPDRAWAAEILRHPKLPDILKISIIAERFERRAEGRTIVRQQPRPVVQET